MQERITHVGFSVGAPSGDLAALGRAVAKRVEIGATLCELSAVTLDCVSACRLIPDRIAEAKAVLAKAPIRFTLHGPIAVNLMDESHLDHHMRAARVTLELAAELGADIVVFHPGRVSPQAWAAHSAALLDGEVAALSSLGDVAARLGLRIAYENPSPTARMVAGVEVSYALDPRALAVQLEKLGHASVVMCLDVAHLRQNCTLLRLDDCEAARRVGALVGHVHFSDAAGPPATIVTDNVGERLWFGIGDMHATAGWGTCDYAGLAASLAPLPGTGITIELASGQFEHGAVSTFAAARHFAASIAKQA